MVNVYIGLAVNGFFTGLGVVSANYFYDKVIKPKLERLEAVHRSLKSGGSLG